MTKFNLKATHKAIKDYYSEIEALKQQSLFHEGAVAPHFANLLRHCATKVNWNLAEQVSLRTAKRLIRPDGILTDTFNFRRGIWEAKDTGDDFEKEVKAKFAAGYPKNNILFQSPERMIIWQDNRLVFNENITDPGNLAEGLKIFFSHEPEAYKEWEEAADAFRDEIPEVAGRILKLVDEESRVNKPFARASENFADICRESVNPNLSADAIREMLIQHLLTERIFRTVFNNPDFINKNIIAHEIEKVIAELTSRHFSRGEFLKPLDRFYKALEMAAATISEYSEKQSFLNTVYEKFFQGFSVKMADTHGIVYTPQPVVSFMVKSVEHILRKEFGKSLSDKGVHILDPFVGTGNFIIRVMREMKKTSLEYKYLNELHCNEVLLLPYYIASMNIEHEYVELTGEYRQFEGICLADTFELAEKKQSPVFIPENVERVTRQNETQIFVIIGNPPYNAGQVNENDNNKNRKYETTDKRVAETYAKDSKATNKNALSDVYVKAIKWASDRISENREGIVAFITNNSFIESIAFDGMRKQLEKDFDKIYIFDLGGNVRKNPKLSGTTHNVFGIQVGVSINIFVKKRKKGI